MTKSKEIRRADRLMHPGKSVSADATRKPIVGQRHSETFSGEDGSTLAEMAMVLPVLLVVLTGIFSFGIALNQYLVLTNAVNAGARAFALSAGGAANSTSTAPSGDPCAYAATTVNGAASNLSTSNLTYTIVYTVNSSGAQTTYSGTGSSSPSCTGLLMNPNDIVQVKAVYPVTPAMYGWSSKSLSLTAQSTELVQ